MSLNKEPVTFILRHNMPDITQIIPFMIPQDKVVSFIHEFAMIVKKYGLLKNNE